MNDLPDDLLPELDGDPRKLRFLEWLLTAPSEREPATITAFAASLGLDRRTVTYWRAKDSFQAVWRREAAKVAGGIERTQVMLDRLYAIGESDDKDRVPAIREFLKTTQAISPKDTPRQENPLARMTKAELEAEYRLMLGRELAVREARELSDAR
jgi:hypothetical protein